MSVAIPAIFVMIIGIMFIISASGVLDPHHSWKTATAVVTGYDKINKVLSINYNINGQIIQNTIKNFTEALVNGTTFTIKVNPSDVYDIYIWSFNGAIPTLFLVVGSFLIAIPASIVIIKVLLLVHRNNKVKNFNTELNLNYQPSFLFEYKPMNNQEARIYHFTPSEENIHNFSVVDDNGKEYFGTECLSKFNFFGKTYQLIDYTTRQTIIVKLSKGSNKSDSTQIPVKVDNKNFVDYFIERHVNFNRCFDEKKKVNIYTIFNGTNKIGEIYDEPGYRNVYMIKTMKENIDDIALFLLCLSYSNN